LNRLLSKVQTERASALQRKAVAGTALGV